MRRPGASRLNAVSVASPEVSAVTAADAGGSARRQSSATSRASSAAAGSGGNRYVWKSAQSGAAPRNTSLGDEVFSPSDAS
jgi:hypothetical protein